MANTTERHKQKKSQKRKDRQERRRQKQLQRIADEADKMEEGPQENCVVDNEQEKPKKKKSIPGLLAKNKDNIVRWLKDYLLMFMKCDDEGSNYIRNMPLEQHNQLVQDYVDIRILIREISELGG